MPSKLFLAKIILLQVPDGHHVADGTKGPFRVRLECGILPADNQSTTMYSKDNLKKIKTMNDLAPEVMKAFWAFDKAAVAEGAIPVKYKELIAVAVAVTTQCPYCIDIHANNARKAGASETEIVEATMVAASLRAGGAVTHATHALLG
jgi:AhpD family alkylhydroperoxidase